MKTSTHAAGNMLDLDAAFGSLEYSEPSGEKHAARRFEVQQHNKPVELETYQPPGMPAGLRNYNSDDSSEDAVIKARIQQKEKAAETDMIKRIRAKEMQLQQQQQQQHQQQQQQPQQQQQQQPQQQQQQQPQQQRQHQQPQQRQQQQPHQQQYPPQNTQILTRRNPEIGEGAAAASLREVRSAGAFSRFSKSFTEEKGGNCWITVLVVLGILIIMCMVGGGIYVVVNRNTKPVACSPPALFVTPPSVMPPPPRLSAGGAGEMFDLL
jgi:flagellar motor protein MotB